ncbi:MAG: hypothetical protein GY703_15125 [Gammaproteobacteria bacterium]|nr:hypothetical protein [Gammaproteobacteria bacterium]
MISILKTTILLCLSSGALAASGSELTSNRQEPRLGPPIKLDSPVAKDSPMSRLAPLSVGLAAATGGFSVDPSNRQLSRAFYNSVFSGTENIDTGWGGTSHPTCDSGTTTQAFKDVVVARANYFRAMAGVPASMTLNDTWSEKAQDAALMFSANNSLSHSPPPEWLCYTAEGAEAAGKSNISWGNHGSVAVFSQMQDNGAGNSAAGHRRWLLNPWANQLGTGDIPPGDQAAANSIWIIQNYDPTNPPRPTTRDYFVAWPPPGHVPYQLVFPRWSFSYPDADFTNASVTMTKNGANLPTTTEPLASWVGENTIVWYPSGSDPVAGVADFKPLNGDEVYGVNIENVLIDGNPIEFNYSVMLIDPSIPGNSEEKPIITGAESVTTGLPSTYSITPMSFAVDHGMTACSATQLDYANNAEAGMTGLVDGTSPGYSATISSVGANGSTAFHLSIISPPNPTPGSPDYIELAETFVPSSGSLFKFKTKLGLSLDSQVARAQISVDDGENWTTVWEQQGQEGVTDNAFINRSVSLAAYENKPIRFRFTYGIPKGISSWSWYSSGSSAYGLLLDDIEITLATKIENCSTTSLGTSTSFDFTPPAAGFFALYSTAYAWTGYSGVANSDMFFLESTTIPDTDNDGIVDPSDAFIDNPAAAVDTDGDGMPDEFLPACDLTCQSNSGLVLDADDDNDGVPDTVDPDPLNAGVYPSQWFAILNLILEID